MKTAGSHQASGGTFPVTEVLLSTTVVDVQVTTKQALYTVPAGKKAIVTRTVFRNGAVSPTGDGSGKFGGDVNATDWVCYDTDVLTVADSYKVMPVAHNAPTPTYGPGVVFGYKQTADTTATTVDVDVFGYLV